MSSPKSERGLENPGVVGESASLGKGSVSSRKSRSNSAGSKSLQEKKGIENPVFVNEESGEQAKDDSSSSSVSSVSIPEGKLDATKQRENWDNPLEFLMSCIAMSVGLGNIWRFPFVAYENGGGAFLIPYLIVLFFIGRPLYFLEMILGQFSSSSSVNVWDIAPIAKGIGFGQAIATGCVATYYLYLMALAIFYFICSFMNPLPWTVCDPAWSTNDTCYESDGNLTYMNLTGLQSSAEQFFYNNVVKRSDNLDNGLGTPDWRMTICLFIGWFIIFVVLSRGVSSSGKVAYFTALFPYVILITLLIRGCTLPGAGDGILFFITPVWEKIATVDVWYAAVTQCFFSLSVGFGPIVTFASYNNFRHRIYRDSTIVSLADTGTSILAGVTVFAILGNLAYESGKPIEDVVQGGLGLAFVSYPEAISKFDTVPQLFGVLFFAMLIILAVGSSNGMAGSVITLISDEFPNVSRWIVAACVCSCGFLIGLVYVTPGGLYIFDLVDYFGGGFIIYIMVISEVVVVCWIYGLKQIVKDIRYMLGFGIGIYWKLTWSIIIPIALLVIFIYAMVLYKPLVTYDKEPYPPGIMAVGWVIASIAICQLIGWGAYVVSKQPGNTWTERFKSSLRPASTWGPKDPEIKAGWIDYNNQSVQFFWLPKLIRRPKT